MLVNQYTESIWPLHVSNISCGGDESQILDCPYSSVSVHTHQHCGAFGDAGVICQCEFCYNP